MLPTNMFMNTNVGHGWESNSQPELDGSVVGIEQVFYDNIKNLSTFYS